MLQREEEFPEAIGAMYDIVVALHREVAELAVAFVRLLHPTNLGAPDGVPTRFVIFFLAPEREEEAMIALGQARYSRDIAEIQPRYSRDLPSAEWLLQARYSRDTAEI